MKRVITVLLGILFSVSLISQVPQQISYQGVIRDAAGEPMTGMHNVDISIYTQLTGGTALFTETHAVAVNEFGVFTVQIGSQAGIDNSIFNESSLYLAVSVNGTEIGRSQILSVPFAMIAESAYSLAGADGMGEGSGLDADLLDGNNSDYFMSASDAALLYQDLGIEGYELSISDGDDVVLPEPRMDSLGDVDLTGLKSGDLLVYNGTEFVPASFTYYYPDNDRDGYGEGPEFIFSPVAPDGYADNMDDCDDTQPAANPGADEILDGIDNNCDGSVDEGFCVDLDGDGYGEGGDCLGADCDDGEGTVHEGAVEICGDGLDNDCNGQVDDGCLPVPEPGDIFVTEFMANPSALSDTEGEWIEIYNASSTYLELKGMVIKDYDSNEFTIETSLVIDPDDYIVIAASINALGPAGVDDIDYLFPPGTFTLANSGDEIVLEMNGTILFDIAYDETWGNGGGIETGISSALHPEFFDLSSAQNSDFWSSGIEMYQTGDYGTPGDAN